MKQSNVKTKQKKIPENIGYDNLLEMENLTVLYLRISREDAREGESYSIENQRKYLLEFAEQNNFENIIVLSDDGISGVTDNLKEFQKMINLVKEDKVQTVIVKDMSRLGRNYLSVGEYAEYLFPTHDVRLIAVNDNVDTIDGLDDFAPFRNVMNEWYCKDISRKRRATNHILDKEGKPIGQPPYGYRWNENKTYWLVDEEASEIVQKIFRLRLNGYSTAHIAQYLKEEKVYIPTVYMMKKGLRKMQNKVERGEYFWNPNGISKILKNQKYCGDVINFQTYSRSYKLKERIKNVKEDWSIHEDVHKPIIDRETFKQVQKTFQNTSMQKPKDKPKHMLAGYLVCSDCGKYLHYKTLTEKPQNDYFSCGNNRVSKDLCPLTHHIRVDVIEEATRQMIARVTSFARDYEDEFVKIVVSEKYKQIQIEQRKNQKKLATMKARQTELDILFEKLYEDRTLGVLPEKVFLKMAKKYNGEQAELDASLAKLQKEVDKDKSQEMNVDSFLKMVQKYTQVNELTPEIIRHFIDKIVVHHREETSDSRTQKVEFYFNFVGKVELPYLTELKPYKNCFGKNTETKKENHTAEAI